MAPINQIVSLTGPWGLSFLLFFPAAVLATRRPVLIGALVVVATSTCLYGVLRLDATALPQLSKEFQTLATSNKIELVVGLTVFGPDDYNRALVFHPDGSALTSYDKHHLIPGLEPYTPGDHLAVFNGWPCCAASRTASRWPATAAKAASPSATRRDGSCPRRRRPVIRRLS